VSAALSIVGFDPSPKPIHEASEKVPPKMHALGKIPRDQILFVAPSYSLY